MESFDPTKLTSLLGSKLDAKTKFMVLNMIDPRPINRIDEMDPVKHSFSQDNLEALLKGKVDYLICDDLFEAQQDLLNRCRVESESLAR